MLEALHLSDLLHVISQGMLYPTIAILILLIAYMIWCLGSLFTERIVERRHFKVALPSVLANVEDASWQELPDVIAHSGLLGKQKRDILTLVAYGYLPEESRIALAKRLLASEEERYMKVVSRTDLMAKVSPMFGLMGTLIPLGPGVVALGQKNTELLASSIEIAFDTTVAGLLVAVVSMFVSRFRRRWYDEYMVTLEAVMAAILEKARNCLEDGEDLGNSKSAAKMEDEIWERYPSKGFNRGKRIVADAPTIPDVSSGQQPTPASGSGR